MKNGNKKNPTDLQLDMVELGIDNFSFNVIEECNRSVVNDREIYWISEHNSHKNGYNMVTPKERWNTYQPINMCRNKV